MQTDVSLADAACALQSEFESGEGLTAVLAPYDGPCVVVRFGAWGDASGPPVPATDVDGPLLTDTTWDLSPHRFRAAVTTVRRRVEAGDVYVLNLTARLSGSLTVDTPIEAFAALQSRAGADMAALLEGLPGAVPWIASVSPERFLRVRRDAPSSEAARTVEVSPIKGTRPRGATAEIDEALALELRADAKERAEHVMVVDLERNDLGVVCVPGSIHVDPVCEVFSTPYCQQMVSTVRGILRPDATFADLLTAAFPCGSVTGAPKMAAMRIARELEATPRGTYCGALLVAVRGELDSSVLIRTLAGVAGRPGHAAYGAGAGITHDSDPAAEHLEMLLKASPVTGDGAPPVALRETTRVVGRCAPLFDRHLARLAAGGCGPTLLGRVRAEVEALLGRDGDPSGPARLGVTVTPDGGVSVGLTHEPSSLAVEGGPRLAPVSVSELPALPPAAAKPASRAFWDRAHRAARLAGADQALLHTPDGTLIDGSTATVWLVRGGELETPPAPPAVAGVCRDLVFEVGASLGVSVNECVLTLADLESADEVWLSNAYGGFVPVRGRKGPLGERVAAAVEASFAEGAMRGA